MTTQYGGLFQIENFSDENSARRLERVPLSVGKSSGGYDEAWLQRLVSSHPQALPIAEIEAFLVDAVPICLELGTNAGPVDLLLVSPYGDIVIVECKLWRNPQARREVVGQIIDYAKEFPRMSYESFESAILRAEPAGSAAKSDTLYVRAGAERAGVDEIAFIDAVSRNLMRGRFLLLIVGDGIQAGVESISDFLQQHAGMHFTLALVEVAVFKSYPQGYLVQPRVVMKTHMVPRGVVAIEDERVVIRPGPPLRSERSGSAKASQSAENVVAPATISEARLYETLDERNPSSASALRQFISSLEDIGVHPRYTMTSIIIERDIGDRVMTLGTVNAKTAAFWFDYIVSQAESLGLRDAALSYYKSVASMVTDEQMRAKKLSPGTKSGTANLPLDDLMANTKSLRSAMEKYLAEIDKVTRESNA